MTGSFEGCKVVVVGGSSGMGKGTAADVVAGGGSAVIIGSMRAHQVIAATLLSRPPPTFTQVTSGGKMSTPTGDDAFLHAVELNVRAELAQAETGQPEEEAGDVPIDEWLVDPEGEQHYEVGLRSLLGAVEALEGGSGEVSREPEPTPTANADEVERHPCPRCSVEPGSPCRSRSGTVAAAYHTGRFMKVPRLAKRLRVPTPADRGPGQLWRPGTPP